ncbi:hypothetical protein [Lutibacter citreus]|uniref:hypothetical protein n=1 Tax=Lutibacter citreus TaxID=2138210 RepID=UPI000DBE65D8|nr:hypothetical protein [Lutibacter citreus]
MNFLNPPKELKIIIDSEKIDFLIKSKRNYPKKKSVSLLFFSFFWIAFTSIFVFAFLGPIFKGKEVHFSSNNIAVVASPENLEPLLIPGLVIGLFLIVGIGMLIWAIILFFQDGAYFVGTKTRLIKFRKGNITIKDWEQFTGSINIKSNGNYGDIELELRTGKMKSRKNRSDVFIPDIIYISQIENVFNIEKKCRIRIKENDPTPAITSGSL